MKTPAITVLNAEQVQYTVRAYQHDPRTVGAGLGYGAEAASALGIEARRVFKTLIVDVDGLLTVAVLPVDRRLDLKALAMATGGKRASLAETAVAERATGYVVGGISPIGQRKQLSTVIDDSSLEHETVLVSAGRRGVDVELAPADLVRLTRARTASLTRAI